MKKTFEDQINDCASYIFEDKVVNFLYDIIPLFELYDVEDDSDWVEEAVGEENQVNVRALRTVYLMSKIAEKQAGFLVSIKTQYPRLWLKMKESCGMKDEKQE